MAAVILKNFGHQIYSREVERQLWAAKSDEWTEKSAQIMVMYTVEDAEWVAEMDADRELLIQRNMRHKLELSKGEYSTQPWDRAWLTKYMTCVEVKRQLAIAGKAEEAKGEIFTRLYPFLSSQEFFSVLDSCFEDAGEPKTLQIPS